MTAFVVICAIAPAAALWRIDLQPNYWLRSGGGDRFLPHRAVDYGGLLLAKGSGTSKEACAIFLSQLPSALGYVPQTSRQSHVDFDDREQPGETRPGHLFDGDAPGTHGVDSLERPALKLPPFADGSIWRPTPAPHLLEEARCRARCSRPSRPNWQRRDQDSPRVFTRDIPAPVLTRAKTLLELIWYSRLAPQFLA